MAAAEGRLGRYLAPYLAGTNPDRGLEPPHHSIDVEVSLPVEWHREPMALGPLSFPEQSSR